MKPNLQKMLHRTPDGTIKTITHIVGVAHGGEYTICGLAIPDSNLKFNDFESIGDEYVGSYKKCDCPTCLRLVTYIKQMR